MSSSKCFSFLIVFPLFFTAFAVQNKTICPFKSFYQFGDSLADTGNRIRQPRVTSSFKASSLPYGETYFHKPTGRFSNGLLVIDFIARALHLPLLPPYLQKNVSFSHGVNFAVGGSTALDNRFFAIRNITVPSSNTPLSLQLKWFKKYLKSEQHKPLETKKRLRKALFIVGEMGANDYNHALVAGKSLEEMRTYVPFVIEAIVDAVKEVIQLGASHIVVPGYVPAGCFPAYLTSFPGADHEAYDDMGCLRGFNKFSQFHNSNLQKALAFLRSEIPHVVILYFDFYGAFMSVFQRAPYLGFDQRSLLKACCGTGGMYNFNNSKFCGTQGVRACLKPAEFINWDGAHLTQEAHRYISEHFIGGVLSKIPCLW